MKRLLLVELLAVSVLTLLAALGFGRVFATSGYLLPALGAVIVPTLLAVGGKYRKASATATALCSLGAFIVYTCYVVLGSSTANLMPTMTTVQQLAEGITAGWANLLNASLPAAVEPNLLIAVLALVWAAAAAGAEFAQRGHGAAAPVLPALALYLGALGFGASQPAGTLLLPAAFSAALLAVFLVHANRGAIIEPASEASAERWGPHRPLSVKTSATQWIALGLPVIAVTTLLATLITARLPVGSRSFDPRRFRPQEVVFNDVASPLEGLKRELTSSVLDPSIRYQVALDSGSWPATVDRLRLTVLDHFDGAVWSSNARYNRTGSVLPKGPDIGVRTEQVRLTVRIVSPLAGPWLPAIDRPVSVSDADGRLSPALDPVTGVLIHLGGNQTGLSYQMVSMVPRPTPQQLTALNRPVISEETKELLDVANMPLSMRQLAERLTEARAGPVLASDSAYSRLAMLQDSLAARYRYDEDSPSGTSYGRLSTFLTGEGSGYAEQFASTFAVMARSLGYPSRLAVGYLLTHIEPDTGTTVRLSAITNRQAHVWPEVLLGDGLWVAFEPTPLDKVTDSPPPRDPRTEALSGAMVGSETPASSGASPASTENRTDLANRALPALALFGVTIVLGLALVPAGLIILKRLRRRRRRRYCSTSDQVLGAWSEVTDRLLEVGVDVTPTMTAKEVLAITAPKISDRAAQGLSAMVPLVGLALYGPEPPTPTGAATMWGLADAFCVEILDGSRWYRSAVARLNPKPLLAGLTRR